MNPSFDSVSFPFEDIPVEDFGDDYFNLDVGLEGILDDPKVDLSIFGIPNELPTELLVDNSDSDSGISNYGDKRPFLGALESVSTSSPDCDSPTRSVTTMRQANPFEEDALHFKASHSRPPEFLITSPRKPTVTISESQHAKHNLLGNIVVKPEPPTEFSPMKSQMSTTPNSSPAKIPQILSRGLIQGVSKVTSGYGVRPLYYTGPVKDRSSNAVVSSVLNLPAIDECTFSNSFQVLPPPTESESIEKLVKKQERMIKNRQAACLSRLRKKEYLERLEHRLNQLRQENAHLRMENNEWRHRYDHLEKCLGDLQAEYSSFCHSSDDGKKVSQPPVDPPVPPSQIHSPHVSVASPLSPLYSSAPKISVKSMNTKTSDRSAFQKVTYSSERFVPLSSRLDTALPRGVRKKVTTSLFALVCLLLVNLSFTPFNQPIDDGSVAFNRALGHVDIGHSDYSNPVGSGRALLSVDPLQDNPGVAVQQRRDEDLNSSSVGLSLEIPKVAPKFASRKTDDDLGAGCCLPTTLSDTQSQLIWILLGDEEGVGLMPPIERRKQMAHSRHTNASSQTPSQHYTRWFLAKKKVGLSQGKRRLQRAYVVRLPVERELAPRLPKGDHQESLCLLRDSVPSNLTVLLNSAEETQVLVSGRVKEATDKGRHVCTLELKNLLPCR